MPGPLLVQGLFLTWRIKRDISALRQTLFVDICKYLCHKLQCACALLPVAQHMLCT